MFTFCTFECCAWWRRDRCTPIPHDWWGCFRSRLGDVIFRFSRYLQFCYHYIALPTFAKVDTKLQNLLWKTLMAYCFVLVALTSLCFHSLPDPFFYFFCPHSYFTFMLSLCCTSSLFTLLLRFIYWCKRGSLKVPKYILTPFKELKFHYRLK